MSANMLLQWGCKLRCGKEVLGESIKKTFREFAEGRNDIVELWVQFPGRVRVYAEKDTQNAEHKFEFRVRKALEYGDNGISSEAMYWILATNYQGKIIEKRVWPDGKTETIIKGG